MLIKHPSHFDLKLGVQGTDSRNTDLSGLPLPSSLGIIISTNNDNASQPDPLSIPSDNNISDENTVQNHTMFSAGRRDDQYKNDEKATSDNSDISSISLIDSDKYLNINTSLSNLI